MKTQTLSALSALSLLAGIASADVQVSKVFDSNMVLQRDRPVPVWGTAEPGETVTVSFAGQTKSAAADAKGDWTVVLDPLELSAVDRTMTVKDGGRTIEFKNVLVGDVWLCSGQSNMEMTMNSVYEYQKFRDEAAQFPTIRRMKIPHVTALFERTEVPVAQAWCKASSSFSGASATAYFFARKVVQETGVPIGLLEDNWSGCRIEPFMSAASLHGPKALKTFADEIDKVDPASAEGRARWTEAVRKARAWADAAEASLADGAKTIPPLPELPNLGAAKNASAQYNAMVAPLVRFPIRGALWYQGCSNGGEGESYRVKLTALIDGWRKAWGYEFPFYFVQLASYTAPTSDPAGGNGYANIRDAMRRTLDVPQTGMAVAIDVGNAGDIHPKAKLAVGERLALWALARDYGKKVVCSGPLYKGMDVEGGKVRLSFDYVGSGLMVGKKDNLSNAPVEPDPGTPLAGFAIAGADKKWVWADAVIDGDTVVVSSPEVAEPVAVRYAFRANPMGRCNLYNKEGLPASPFRTDAW